MYFFESKDNANKNISHTFVFTPFVRYYFGNNKVKPFFNTGIGFGISKSKSESDLYSSESTCRISSFELSEGLAYFINNSISLDFDIGFASYTYKHDDDNDATYKSVKNNFEMGLAFNFLLF